MPEVLPILQFGTSRFLLAHVDLFVSEAMAVGDALGGIAVVQSTGNAASLERIAALAAAHSYPVRIRGLRAGSTIDETRLGTAVQAAFSADAQWPQVVEAIASGVQVIVSNTGDGGYALSPLDQATALEDLQHAPRSFPAKLLVALYARWKRQPQAPLSILPCELVTRNGDTLRDILANLASDWAAPAEFNAYLRQHCIWANSLVDRIVSEPLHPVGAVAEPYALWAIESQPGLVLPCKHPAIVMTDDLPQFERLKLHLLNLGHSYLAERWLQDKLTADLTVFQGMNMPSLRADLESVWIDEVVPVLAALGQGEQAKVYLVDLRERLLNPFLQHRISDIAQNHAQKKARRIAPVMAWAKELCPALQQPKLLQAMASV